MAERIQKGGEWPTAKSKLIGGLLIGGALGEVVPRPWVEWSHWWEVNMGGAGRVRSGKSPPESSESPQNLLKMVVDESGEESTPRRAPQRSISL